MKNKLNRRKFYNGNYSLIKRTSIFFLVTFTIIFYFLTIFNTAKVNDASEVIKQKINNVYDIVRQITPFYLNTDVIHMKSGIHHIGDIAVMVNEEHEVKSISTAMNEVEKKVKQLVKDDFWGLAVIQRTDTTANTAHFKPLREVHIALNSQGLHDENWIERIMEFENIPYPYADFGTCDLKLTEEYVESYSHENIRSVFHPFYNERKLIGVVLLDLKYDFISNWISVYNKDNRSKIEISLSKPRYEFVILPALKKILLPCTPESGVYYVTINWLSLSFDVFVYALFLSFFYMIFEVSRHCVITLMAKDKMTGLLRRDVFDKFYKHLCQESSIIVVDIDNFKNINDNHGHLIGDLVIKKVSEIIRNSIRKDDISVRWGGEEFVIVLDFQDKKELSKKAELIRNAVMEDLIHGLNVTVSVGISSELSISFEKQFKNADLALYKAKKLGRNRVVFYEN